MSHVYASTIYIQVDDKVYYRPTLRDSSDRSGIEWENEMRELHKSFTDYMIAMSCHKSGYIAIIYTKDTNYSYSFGTFVYVDSFYHQELSEYYIANLRDDFDKCYTNVLPMLLKIARFCSSGGDPCDIEQYMGSGPKSARIN